MRTFWNGTENKIKPKRMSEVQARVKICEFDSTSWCHLRLILSLTDSATKWPISKCNSVIVTLNFLNISLVDKVLISFHINPYPNPREHTANYIQDGCTLWEQEMEISVVAVAELRLVTFGQIDVALQTRETLSKLGALFRHQFSKPLSPKLPFPAEMIHFGQRMNFPLSFYNSTPQWSSSFFLLT